MWGKSLVEEYGDLLEFVGLCDINPGRLSFAKEFMGVILSGIYRFYGNDGQDKAGYCDCDHGGCDP